MQLLNADEWDAFLIERHLFSFGEGRVRPPRNWTCRTTTFEPNGTVGADLSHLLLTEFPGSRVDAGVLAIQGFDPDPAEQRAVISCVLASAGSAPDWRPPAFLRFTGEYVALTAVMSWCLACGWEFDFVADDVRYVIGAHSDERVSIAWDADTALSAAAGDLLRNLEFSERHAWLPTLGPEPPEV